MTRSMPSESLVAVISHRCSSARTAGPDCRARDHARHAGDPQPDPRNKIAQMYSVIQTSLGAGMQTLDQNLRRS